MISSHNILHVSIHIDRGSNVVTMYGYVSISSIDVTRAIESLTLVFLSVAVS